MLKFIRRAALALAGLAMMASASCNKDSNETEIEYIPAQSVAVTGFSLLPDIRIMKDIDSVYFAIDLEHGVIYNPDSLPKGTNVGRVMTKISYPSTVTSAKITMQGGSHRADGVIDYKSNPNDTIDYTGRVTLILSDDNGLSKSYILKVNVHKQNPDSIIWTNLATASLPSRLMNPKAQKSVSGQNAQIRTLIEESDGSFTIAECEDIFSPSWKKSILTFPGTPNITSFTFCDNKYYMLSADGTLHESTDASSWSACTSVSGSQQSWTAIIGVYNNCLLGLRKDGGQLISTSWPANVLPECILPADFPVEGFSQIVCISTDWAFLPTGLIFGGKKADGSLSYSTWAFDGTQWADMTGGAAERLPALYAPMTWKYTTFMRKNMGAYPRAFETLIAMGGRLADGSLNPNLYVSYDNGITWMKAPASMQDAINLTPTYGSDIILASTQKSSPLDRYWTEQAKSLKSAEINYSFENGDIIWDCPYIFLLGGYDADNVLRTTICRGVLERLTFAPLF